MNALVKSGLATPRQAAQVANQYVSCFAYRVHEPDVFLAKVTELLSGLPLPVLKGVCNPTYGAVTRGDKPCLQTLKKWIDDWVGKTSRRVREDLRQPIDRKWVWTDKTLGHGRWEPYEHKTPTEEESEHIRQLISGFKIKNMLEETKEITVYTSQNKNRDLLTKSLNNLEALNGRQAED